LPAAHLPTRWLTWTTLALASSAFADPVVNMDLLSGGQSEITVNVSDIFYVDIEAQSLGAATHLISTGEFTIMIDGPASFEAQQEFTLGDWGFDGAAVTLTYELVDPQTLVLNAAYVGTMDMFMLPLPGIALDHIAIHCDGLGDVYIVAGVDRTGGSLYGPVVWYGGGQAGTDLEATTGQLIVHQIPEPMTVLLLGLGGLFLRRRK